MDSSEDDVIVLDDSPIPDALLNTRSEKKMLNIQVDKESSTEDEPAVIFIGDDSNQKSEKDEVEDDGGLDSEQDDPTGSFHCKFKYHFSSSTVAIIQY